MTDPSGVPKNGAFNMKFAIYDDATVGTKLWEETINGVQVTNGIFTVILGQTTALTPNIFIGGATDSFGPVRYLDVMINGESLIPRRRITSSASAIVGGGPTGP